MYEAVQNIFSENKIIEAPKPQSMKATEPIQTIHPQIKVEETKTQVNGKSESLNEVLIQSKTTELVDKLEHLPITDLKSAISFNDRFSFVQNLFSGNADVFKNVVEQINSANNFVEAEKIISNHKNEKWAENAEVAASFMELVSRRFAMLS